MNKINWQNGTLVSPAKVEIGGVIYEVTPEQYSGNTPLSAENLNQMQDNIEEAIPEVIDNLTSSSTSKALSANQGKELKTYVDGLNTYSTTEQEVGTWIDNKPIYRKVISFTSTTSPYRYTHNISNIDKIVNFYGYNNRASDPATSRPLQAYNTAYPSYYASVDSISRTTVEVFAGDSIKASITWYIVIEYTKTTD